MITHESILSRLAELRATAEVATPRDWTYHDDSTEAPPGEASQTLLIGSVERHSRAVFLGWTEDDPLTPPQGKHAALWSPAAVLRWLSWAEQVAAEHAPEAVGDVLLCGSCRDRAGHLPWPCSTYAGLAGALGLEET